MWYVAVPPLSHTTNPEVDESIPPTIVLYVCSSMSTLIVLTPPEPLPSQYIELFHNMHMVRPPLCVDVFQLSGAVSS